MRLSSRVKIFIRIFLPGILRQSRQLQAWYRASRISRCSALERPRWLGQTYSFKPKRIVTRLIY